MNVFRKKSVEQTLAETGESGHALKRDLTWWDLAIMGVAVAVGAGIFSIGAQAAAFHAGPAVVLSFLIAGVVCGAAVMCYAEFASMIPVAGSAYTFTYTTVGEIVAWVIGWDLILEMLMAGSVVSKYWGVYLNQFFELIGWNINTNIAIGSFNFDLAPVIIVAFFTDATNPVIDYIYKQSFTNQQFGYGAAMSWVYFAFALLLCGISMGVMGKFVFVSGGKE